MTTSPSAPSFVNADDYDGPELDYDFDEAWAELRPKRVKVLGKVYQLPPERPAKVMILLMRERRARAQQDETRAFALLEEILTAMFGAAAYQQILADGIGMDTQLAALVDYCMRAYNPTTDDDEGDDGEGEAEPPATGASATGRRRSSATGRSSKRTSSASTSSTSSRRSTTA